MSGNEGEETESLHQAEANSQSAENEDKNESLKGEGGGEVEKIHVEGSEKTHEHHEHKSNRQDSKELFVDDASSGITSTVTSVTDTTVVVEDGKVVHENETQHDELKDLGVITNDELRKRKIYPSFSEKFRPGDVQEMVKIVVDEILGDSSYDEDMVKPWISSITSNVNERLKEMNFTRYKFITSVIIGELRGQGVNFATKCVWDESTDYGASFKMINDTMFCTVNVFGIYFY